MEKSDKNAVAQCKKWLEETQNYSSVEISHHPTDIIGVSQNGESTHVEVKMTGKEWRGTCCSFNSSKIIKSNKY